MSQVSQDQIGSAATRHVPCTAEPNQSSWEALGTWAGNPLPPGHLDSLHCAVYDNPESVYDHRSVLLL